MGDVRLGRRHGSGGDDAAWARNREQSDVDRLLEENAQLRELVIQLTKIATKNIVAPPRRAN